MTNNEENATDKHMEDIQKERSDTVMGVDAGADAPHTSNQTKSSVIPNLCLFLSVVLFAASNSSLAYMLDMGPPYFTTCNILCVSNIFAVITTGPIFHKDLRWAKLRGLRWKDWLAILGASLFRNVAGAYFEVEGLSRTSIPTFAIVEMLEPVEFLLFALCLMPGERRNAWIFGNAALLLVGVLIALLEPAMEGKPIPSGEGVLYLAIGGFFYVLAELVGHNFLEHIPLGIYAMARVLLGTLFFHLLAWGEGTKSELGTSALENIYSVHLWLEMAWYGTLFITMGQFVWLTALSQCRPQAISLATSSMFLFNLAFGAIILGATPSRSQYIGSAFIVASLGSSLLESRRHPEEDEGGPAKEEAKKNDVERKDVERGGKERGEEGEEAVEKAGEKAAGTAVPKRAEAIRQKVLNARQDNATPSKHF